MWVRTETSMPRNQSFIFLSLLLLNKLDRLSLKSFWTALLIVIKAGTGAPQECRLTHKHDTRLKKNYQGLQGILTKGEGYV